MSLEEVVLECQLTFLDSITFQWCNPWNNFKQVLEELEVDSPKVQGCNTTYCLVSSVQDPGFHHLRAATSLYILTIPSLYLRTGSSSTPVLFGSSTTCISVLSSVQYENLLDSVCLQNIRVIELPCENQCLWLWGYFQLSLEGLINLLFSIISNKYQQQCHSY